MWLHDDEVNPLLKVKPGPKHEKSQKIHPGAVIW